VRFIPGFGESSLDFTLICQVKEFVDQYLAQHELRKRIFKRFKAEGIDMPFPHRTVYLREEKEWKK
jgi:small-conductance mechanosensitive channel